MFDLIYDFLNSIFNNNIGNMSDFYIWSYGFETGAIQKTLIDSSDLINTICNVGAFIGCFALIYIIIRVSLWAFRLFGGLLTNTRVI